MRLVFLAGVHHTLRYLHGGEEFCDRDSVDEDRRHMIGPRVWRLAGGLQVRRNLL